jgi:hypothetical protein
MFSIAGLICLELASADESNRNAWQTNHVSRHDGSSRRYYNYVSVRTEHAKQETERPAGEFMQVPAIFSQMPRWTPDLDSFLI